MRTTYKTKVLSILGFPIGIITYFYTKSKGGYSVGATFKRCEDNMETFLFNTFLGDENMQQSEAESFLDNAIKTTKLFEEENKISNRVKWQLRTIGQNSGIYVDESNENVLFTLPFESDFWNRTPLSNDLLREIVVLYNEGFTFEHIKNILLDDDRCTTDQMEYIIERIYKYFL